MKKKERANYILKELERLFPQTPIPLDHTNSFTLLIAVLLSAQTTDIRVNIVTPPLFRIADSPLKMSKLSIKEIEKFIKSVGLAPRKAKQIYNLSHILINNFEGKVPESFKDLESLPGVGHKTASVVMSQAFGHPAFPVDTHIHRLAQIWGLTKGKNVTETERDLKKLFPKESWNKLHLQIIFFGRENCTARNCNGIYCGLCKDLYPNRKSPLKYNKT